MILPTLCRGKITQKANHNLLYLSRISDHFGECILCMFMFSSFLSQGLIFKEFAMQVKKCIFVTGFAMRAEKCTIVTEFVLWGHSIRE